MAIKLNFQKTDADLTGRSKWWGAPDLPMDMPFPTVPVDDDGDAYDDPMTFICQIRCEDLIPFDKDNLLPHNGMLYFFAAIDYFLGNLDAFVYPGMGEWNPINFKVLYSPTCDDIEPYEINYDDGTPAYMPAEAITFELSPDANESFHLLGKPYYEEIREQYPDDMISLLQIDENDDWDLRFVDCGMVCFMISPDDLRNRYWNGVKCYLHSF